MNHLVNISLQILPLKTDKDPYVIVDKAIEVIKNSGLRYKVCPFETVMEGEYDKIMSVIKEVHQICLNNGTEKIFANVKMQISRDSDVYIDDKMNKYA